MAVDAAKKAPRARLVVVALLIAAASGSATADAAQFRQFVPYQHPRIELPQQPHQTGPTGAGSLPACYDCSLPKGYTLNPTFPGERCLQKRVDCTCSSPGGPPVRATQGMCLYPLVPIPTYK